ncbi:hypothetical protein SISNIDRAFT_448521 [Sistotremastrum niveocremeum HHB9708]|uniref:DUF1746 domain-containing protein n=1 Tax=Sistotremastrum niveocremeum HHB9708 TaxID=1314777 RepID=A0A165A0E4_9AGAM|nr:hypothetical protein SISNIDRAFT_448521 [Sistotremastrum niveocremeum HHB9708]
MLNPVYAQRQHLIRSLDSTLKVLHVLSHLQSPSLWALFCRITAQAQFPRPREIDARRSLRFWIFMVLLVNASPILSHVSTGPSSASIMLDFVGSGHKPSRQRILALDLLIIFLQFLQIYIAYETSVARTVSPGDYDALAPISLQDDAESAAPKTRPDGLILHVQFRRIIQRLRGPTPPPPDESERDSLPLSMGGAFLGSRRFSIFPRPPRPPRINRPQRTNAQSAQTAPEDQRIPGGMNME